MDRACNPAATANNYMLVYGDVARGFSSSIGSVLSSS
jgi:hypothetical protein